MRITTATLLEVGNSARTPAQARSVFRTPPISAMPVEHLTPAIEDRASEVQVTRAGKGNHRAPSIPDLIIAAVAELVGITVLHVDNDFELIAELTGQPVERQRRRCATDGNCRGSVLPGTCRHQRMVMSI